MKKTLISILPVLGFLVLPLTAQAQVKQVPPTVVMPQGQVVTKQPPQSTCQAIKDFQTTVKVNILQPKARYDFTQSRENLKLVAAKDVAVWATRNKMDLLWTSNDLAKGGAYAAGAMAVSYDIKTDSRAVDSYGAFYCPYVKTANVDILYATVVMMPSEAKPVSCANEIVTKHEENHLKAAADYMTGAGPQIESGLNIMLGQMSQGNYVAKGGLQHALNEADGNVRGAVQVYYRDAIRAAIMAQMKQIDNPESQAGLAALVAQCPPPKAASVFQLPGAK